MDISIVSNREYFAEFLGLNKFLPGMVLAFALAHIVSPAEQGEDGMGYTSRDARG